jgi:Flp pilus assembly protein TadG
MIYDSSARTPRHGVAALELASVLPVVLILLFGLWDVGRMVEVQQLVNNAAREGARLAAIGSMLDPTTGTERDIYATDVQQTVTNYLARNGINTTGITVQFANLDNPGARDPYLAQHLEHLRVSVQLPSGNVRLLLTNAFTNNSPVVLNATADWLSLKDSNVTVPTTLPTN